MESPFLYHALLMVVLALADGQEVSYHPPNYARNYLINYNVSQFAFAYPPYNVTAPDDYMYFGHHLFFPNSDDDTLIIGAKDQLFKLSDNLAVNQVFSWSITPEEFNTCNATLQDKMRLSRIEYECGNHIRVYREFPDVSAFSEAQGRLLVCGSYGLNPHCVTINMNDLSDVGESFDVSSTGICSVHPDAPTYGDFQGTNSRYFAMGFSDDRGKDFPAGMYQITYNAGDKSISVANLPEFGIPSENQWIASQVEIIDFRVQNYVDSGEVYVIFLRENYQISGSTTGTVQSRILRICKNDEGSTAVVGSPSIKYFRSFTKARVVCRHSVPDLPSSTGINEYDWPALRAVAYTESKSRFYGLNGIWSHLIYGVFTGQINAANGTAICVFDTDQDDPPLSIDDHYTAFSIFRDSTFVGEDPDAVSNKPYFNCADPQRDDTLARQTLAVDNVGPYLDNKYPLLEVDGVIGTQLATDTTCVKDLLNSSSCLVQDVLFMGTASGRVMKIVIAARYAEGSGVLIQAEPQVYNNYDYAPVVSEEWVLDDSNEIQSLTVRGDYLYATTVSRVYKFPKRDCARYSSCRLCIGSQDPYCYWDSASSMCVTFSHPNDDTMGNYMLPSDYHQSISSGEDPICNETPQCDLQCVSKTGGFDIIANNCSYTDTFSVRVSSACAGVDFVTMTDLPKTDVLGISNPLILGYRLHTVDVTASYPATSGPLESTYSLECFSQPTIPQPVLDEEITAIAVSTTEVDILVGLKACSITDDPNNYNIMIEAHDPVGITDSFAYTDRTSLTLSSLEKCSSFSYTVTVTNSRGSSTYMSSENATVLPDVPGKPTDVSVSSITSRSANIIWTGPSPAPCPISGYSLYLNSLKIYHCLPLDSSSFTFTGLFPFSDYMVVVRACTTAGEGSASDSVTFTTLCEPPSRVRDLSLAEATPSSLRFTWTAPLWMNESSSSTYTVEGVCYDKMALSVDMFVNPSVPMPTFTLNDLPSLTLCCVTVYQTATCMGVDLSGLPVQVCGTTQAAAPQCPTNLVATPTSYQSLLVQWDPPANAILGLNYTVRIEPVGAASTEMILPVHSLDSTFAFVNGLEPNTSYMVYLTAESMSEGSLLSSGECTSAVGQTPTGTLPAPVDVQLASADCTLVGSWTDPAKSDYDVISYQVYARCNDLVVVETVSSDAMVASFNVCNASSPLFLSNGLSWCTLQVQSCDSFSCGQLSELALSTVPESKPETPLCFITEEVGSRVFISYTLSAPLALNDLYVSYSLVQTSIMLPVNKSIQLFNGNNVLSFDNLFREQEYTFSLQLCDNVTNCGGSCTISFVPNTTTPAYPSNLRCSVNSTAVTVDWDVPVNENPGALIYEIQLGGGELITERNKTIGNGGLSTSFGDLSPFSLYVVSARAIDNGVGTSSPASPAIECRTLSSKPSPLQYIAGRLTMAGDIPTLVITWERPPNLNGNFSNYTFVWGSQTSGVPNPSCQSLYDEADLNVLVVTDYSLTSVTEADSRATATIARAEVIQLCGRVSNLEFTSNWLEESTNATVGASEQQSSSSTALIAVIVLAVISIIVALVIAIILAIAIRNHRNGKLTPSESIEEMKENHHHPSNVKRTLSTKPIMNDNDHDHNSDISS